MTEPSTPDQASEPSEMIEEIIESEEIVATQEPEESDATEEAAKIAEEGALTEESEDPEDPQADSELEEPEEEGDQEDSSSTKKFQNAPKPFKKQSFKEKLSLEEAAPQAQAWLVELFEKMMIPDVRVVVDRDDEKRKLSFRLYPHPTTTTQLNAITSTPKTTSHMIESVQAVLYAFVDRLVGGNITVEFDINDYFRSRSVEFEAIAQELAELSISLKRSLTIAGLTGYDRRVVHNALSSTKGVTTSSVGQGPFRKLCVEPKHTK